MVMLTSRPHVRLSVQVENEASVFMKRLLSPEQVNYNVTWHIQFNFCFRTLKSLYQLKSINYGKRNVQQNGLTLRHASRFRHGMATLPVASKYTYSYIKKKRNKKKKQHTKNEPTQQRYR